MQWSCLCPCASVVITAGTARLRLGIPNRLLSPLHITAGHLSNTFENLSRYVSADTQLWCVEAKCFFQRSVLILSKDRNHSILFVLCLCLCLLCSLIFLTSLIDSFFFKSNKRSYLYLPFCWRQCVMTQMEPVVFVFHVIVFYENVKWIILYSDTHWHFLFVICCW